MNYELDSFNWFDNDRFPDDVQLNKPSQYPCIILALFTKWNDFGIVNSFYAFYFENVYKQRVYLGELKIISKNNTESNKKLNLPKLFTSLPDEFISLGRSCDYYENLQKYLPEECYKICNDLRDVAINVNLRKDYENNYFWKHSIIRDIESERMLRVANYILQRKDFHSKHKFEYEYSFNRALSSNKVTVNFNFNTDNKFFPKRIISIIGKNGVGKTTLIKYLIKDYVNKSKGKFNYLFPEFSLPILVTTSSLDNYNYLEDEKEKFTYCSLMDKDNKSYSEEAQIEKIKHNLEKINTFDYEANPIGKMAIEVISKLIPQEAENIKSISKNGVKINVSAITEIYKRLSSGVKSLLFLMVPILTNIRFDSLIIIDEPELHLHPNFIALFIYTIYKLLDEYSSYAIITTHSPIVIREMKADDVYIMERSGNDCKFRQPKLETLGADLTDITDEVFNTKEIPLHFIEIIEEMKEKNYSKEDIIKNIKSDKRELSLAVELYIESLFFDEVKDEESFN